jgi:hypothetical protein
LKSRVHFPLPFFVVNGDADGLNYFRSPHLID